MVNKICLFGAVCLLMFKLDWNLVILTSQTTNLPKERITKLSHPEGTCSNTKVPRTNIFQ